MLITHNRAQHTELVLAYMGSLIRGRGGLHTHIETPVQVASPGVYPTHTQREGFEHQ